MQFKNDSAVMPSMPEMQEAQEYGQAVCAASDQWERIKDRLPRRKEAVGVTAREITGCLSRRYCIGIVPALPGAICRNGLGTGKMSSGGSAAGLPRGYGQRCLPTWPPTPTTNTQ